jgi:poly(glycerol-phosphate) alpha-glucosyltransferase
LVGSHDEYRGQAWDLTVPTVELPAGSHYAMFEAIPPRFNGMTTSTLQRSRAFVQYAGVAVTVLTWDHTRDYTEVSRQLRANGTLIDGVSIANLWEEARRWDDACLARATFDSAAPTSFEPIGARGEPDGPLRRILRRSDGSIERIDSLREDGSTLLSSLRSGDAERLVLCDRKGEPLGCWLAMDSMLQHWLDQIPRDPVAWVIFDSKVSAAMVADYQRPDVVKIHVVRGSHLVRGEGPMRDLVTSRRTVMENLDAWDSVTFLTASQRADVEARFGHRSNLHVIPNSRNAPARRPRWRRPPGRGVMLATLGGRKRVSHAVRAMAAVRRRSPKRKLRLDVWGSGPMESELRDLIAAKRAPVRLRGYSRTAARTFSSASFSVLTSRSEGLPGVVIESMGRGCIPISYDMPYGPSDIITHGVDGFLVPNGRSRALADQIAWVVTAKHSELAPIRKAARARALQFNDEPVVRLWSTLMAEISDRRGF